MIKYKLVNFVWIIFVKLQVQINQQDTVITPMLYLYMLSFYSNQNILCNWVLPSTWIVVWQLSEVMVYSWRLIMKRKKTTNNYISILKQTLATWCTPTRTCQHLTTQKSIPDSQFSSHKPHKQQRLGWPGPHNEEPGKPRHRCSCSRHLEMYSTFNLVYSHEFNQCP